jgi:acyl carrier protein
VPRYGKTFLAGDFGRIDQKGQISLSGRRSSLEKIRGYRVETHAVENILRRHPDIDEGIVQAVPGLSGDQCLAAYFVENDRADLSAGAIRDWLMNQIPDYMVPSYLIRLDAIPYTESGKVNLRALPPVSRETLFMDSPFKAPETSMEAAIALIWSEVLGVSRVGVNDSFLELGGNSLLATQVVSRVLSELRVRLPASALYNTPTVYEMAKLIEEAAAEDEYNLQVERLLSEVEQLSEDEAKRLNQQDET